MRVAKSELKTIDNSHMGKYLVISSSEQQNKHLPNPTAANLFGFPKENLDYFRIRFDSATNQLLVIYPLENGSESMIRLDGTFEDNYFETYLSNEKIQIPPFFPIIYSKRNIRRLRIGLKTDDSLIIDYKFARDGNIFLLAAGTSGRNQYIFKPM